MTPERQAELISVACKQAGVDSHIRWIERRKEAQTWAEKIAVQFMRAGQQLPVKNSYMFCDTLDMCFFYTSQGVPQAAYAGLTAAASKDLEEGKLAEAFRKADTVLRLMKKLAEEAQA